MYNAKFWCAPPALEPFAEALEAFNARVELFGLSASEQRDGLPKLYTGNSSALDEILAGADFSSADGLAALKTKIGVAISVLLQTLRLLKMRPHEMSEHSGARYEQPALRESLRRRDGCLAEAILPFRGMRSKSPFEYLLAYQQWLGRESTPHTRIFFSRRCLTCEFLPCVNRAVVTLCTTVPRASEVTGVAVPKPATKVYGETSAAHAAPHTKSGTCGRLPMRCSKPVYCLHVTARRLPHPFPVLLAPRQSEGRWGRAATGAVRTSRPSEEPGARDTRAHPRS